MAQKFNTSNNFRGIKLLSHTLWERVVESRLRKMVNISERQYGFQPRKSTIRALSCLRMLPRKTEFGKELHNGVWAYDRVPRELICIGVNLSGRKSEFIYFSRHQGAHLVKQQAKHTQFYKNIHDPIKW